MLYFVVVVVVVVVISVKVPCLCPASHRPLSSHPWVLSRAEITGVYHHAWLTESVFY
jgi:hypothetical protein